MKTAIERDFPFEAAGRVWRVPELHLDTLPDGSTGVSMAEFGRIHRAIAAEICGVPGPLTAAEFEFLADLADVPYAQIAALVGLDRSALTKWMGSQKPMRIDRSHVLKQWFMLRLFAEFLGRTRIPLRELRDPGRLLTRLREIVLVRGGAAPLSEQGATIFKSERPLLLPQLRNCAAPMADADAAIALAIHLRHPTRRRAALMRNR